MAGEGMSSNNREGGEEEEEGRNMNRNKGFWKAEEDAILEEYVRMHGEGGVKWNDIQKKTGLLRCGKSCRQRWVNHLNPNLNKQPFSDAEIRQIIRFYGIFGPQWSRIAAQLPGRTNDKIKNYWNTRVRRHERAISEKAWKNAAERQLLQASNPPLLLLPPSSSASLVASGTTAAASSSYYNTTKQQQQMSIYDNGGDHVHGLNMGLVGGGDKGKGKMKVHDQDNCYISSLYAAAAANARILDRRQSTLRLQPSSIGKQVATTASSSNERSTPLVGYDFVSVGVKSQLSSTESKGKDDISTMVNYAQKWSLFDAGRGDDAAVKDNSAPTKTHSSTST